MSSSKKVEIRMAEAFELHQELQDILKQKASMKLKLELTEMMLRVRTRTDPANQLMAELFRDHGREEVIEGKKQLSLPRFVDGTKEETEAFREYNVLNSETFSFESPLITMELLEKVETDGSYPTLIRMILDNELKQ